uniref:Uncharacterized protein n=1 Tax=Loigolactobacillus rennini TaxID=238013 RepID=A0A1K2I4M6_9LACO|nr:hypothetical protein LREN565_0306 [Loigolactobacillus rennini]
MKFPLIWLLSIGALIGLLVGMSLLGLAVFLGRLKSKEVRK